MIFTLYRAEVQAWDLQSLLIKPVQRVLRYPLFLGQLMKHTESDHPDYKPLHQAREAMDQVAQDINEFKRRKDLGESVTASSGVISELCHTL